MPTPTECQQAAVTGTNTAVTGTFAANPANGDCMYVIITTYKTGATVTHNAPTDSAGNTYTQVGTTLDQQATSSADRVQHSCWKKDNMVGAASFEVTEVATGTPDALTVIAWRLTAVAAAAYNSDTAGAISSGSQTNPVSPVSTLTPPASSLAIGSHTSNLGAGATNGSGWVTPTNGNQTDNSTFQDCWTEWKDTSAAIIANWTRNSSYYSARVATFGPASGGPAFIARKNLPIGQAVHQSNSW